MTTGGAGGCGPTSGTSCARATLKPLARMKPNTALTQCTRLTSFISVPSRIGIGERKSPACPSQLEVEVKSRQELARVHVGGRQPERGSGAHLMQPVVFVMP